MAMKGLTPADAIAESMGLVERRRFTYFDRASQPAGAREADPDTGASWHG